MDLNRYYDFPEIINSTLPYNMPFGQTYEPGSVIKVLTVASALDSGTVTPDFTYIDTGYIEIGGIPIYNLNYGAWGEQDLTGCLQHSLNVCMVTLASKMGPSVFYEYMRSFGIGRTSGMDLVGEPRGRLKLPGDADWFESDLGTNSFGQGVAVTPIQLMAAISALANDGQMVQPHVVYAYTSNGRQHTPQHTPLGNPISSETARLITEILANSLEEEASDAMVEGYRVSGKTGTAQIPTPTGYHPSLTNASFVGWGPSDDPQIMVYVWLQEPTSSPWGSVVAAPVFSEVFERVAVLMNLPPDAVRLQMKNDTVQLETSEMTP
jgi:cell division protein FtsI/penicillin-binding protein 2